MSLRTFSHGTVRWTPLAGRIESGSTPSSSARTSSAHTPGGVDDDAGAATSTVARRRFDDGAVDPAVGVLREGDDAAAVGDDGAVRGGGAGERQDEPGVVGGGVVVEVAAGEPLPGIVGRWANAASAFSRWCSLPMRKPPVRSYIHIADPRARATRRGIRPSLVRIGIMNGSSLTRCGRVAAQPLALVQRLVDQAHVALLEVAQAAVDELGALRRGAAGEVVALDERRAQAPGGGVEGDAGAGDPAADDEHVERLGGQALEHRGPPNGVGTRCSADTAAECRSGPRRRRPLRTAQRIRLCDVAGADAVLSFCSTRRLDGGFLRVAA